MASIQDEEYKIKKILEKEYANLKARKYGKEQLSEEEMYELKAEDLEPSFSGVNQQLSELYKILIRFDDNESYSR